MTTTLNPFRPLLDSIENRTATVGVIGLGYVGLPLVLLFSESGFRVIGFDVDEKKTEALARGESYIRHIGPERVAAAFSSGRREATDDYDRLAECDAILICVPTPLGAHREPDLSYVRMTAEAIAQASAQGQLVVLESTTYPGTTREELLHALQRARGCECGTDFFLAFSPEREDPGNEKFNTKNIPKVVGGIDEPSLRAAVALYSAAIDHIVPVSQHRSRGVVEAAREHLPRREHRPRQRAEGRLRPHGHQRLGSHRRGQHEAVRVHAVLSRARPRRALHPARPVLSDLEGRRARDVGALHRAGRRDQHRHAALRHRSDGRGDQRAGEERARRESARPRAVVQAEHRRRPRVAVVRADRAAARARRRGVVLRSVHPGREARAQVRPRPGLGAVHGRGVRQVRRRAALDAARSVQGRRALSRT